MSKIALAFSKTHPRAPYRAVGQGPGRGRRQRGAFLVEVSLAMMIAAVAAVGTIRENIRVGAIQAGSIQGDALNAYREALETFSWENYARLQQGLPVSKNGVTLAVGTAPGETMRPTVQNLIDMGYLSVGFQDQALVADGATFDNRIERLPAGCAPAACNIMGLAFLTQPVVARGTDEEDGLIVGQILTRIGGNAASSSAADPGTLYGMGGTFTAPNPVAGNPAGVVAARFGFGASGLGQFVLVGDARDPNFQGNLSVAGNTALAGTLQVTQATTLNNSLNVAGATTLGGGVDVVGTTVLNGAVTHNGTTVLNGQTTFNANSQVAAGNGTDYAGAVSNCVRLSGAGVDVICDSAGNVTGGTGRLNAEGLQLARGASSVSLNAAAGTITTTGDVTSSSNVNGQRLAALEVVSEGTACSAGQIAQLNTGGIAVCQAGIFRAPGRFATASSACTGEGTTATDTTTGAGLTCKQGEWRQSVAFMSPFQMRSSWLVSDGTTVAMPNDCGSAGSVTGQPLIFIVPRNDTSIDAAYNRFAEVSGSNWIVRLLNGDGSSSGASRAIAMIYCYYPGA